MNTMSSVSPELNRRLTLAKTKAEYAEEGSIIFIELSYYPIVLLRILTGSKKEDHSTKKHIHMEYVFEPDTYPN